jgi:hypothetical protein
MATSFDFGGLLGNAFGGGLSSLEDLLTPEQRAAIQQQAGLSAAAALLQAAGPSTTRTSLGQALGSAFAAGQAGMQKGTESALTQMLTRQKLDEAKRARDLQSGIARILTGEGEPVSAQGEVTPAGALAAPGMAVGPTVERAAMIGQPVMTANEAKAAQYRRVADTYAAFGKSEDATRFLDMAEKLAPSREEVIGEPIKTATGYVQRTKTGGFKQLPKEFEPASKPTGEPQVVTEQASGKQVLVQRYDDGTYKTVEQFGPARDVVIEKFGDRAVAVDKRQVAPGTQFRMGLAPQVVGGAETGYYVLGGGRGGMGAPAAPAAGRVPAAGGVAPAAPAGGVAPAAPAAATTAPAAAGPATAGLQPVIPGTGKEFENSKALRAEFTTAAKPYVELSQAFQKIESAAKNPSGAGDISLVYGYMKILDPGSVVREGEFATAQNAGGVPDGVRSLYNKALNGQRLSENVRNDFLGQARNLIESQRVLSDDLLERYKALATQYKLKPDQVIFDPFKRIKKPEEIIQGATPPAAVPAPAASAARPTASTPRRFWEDFNLIPRPQ